MTKPVVKHAEHINSLVKIITKQANLVTAAIQAAGRYLPSEELTEIELHFVIAFDNFVDKLHEQRIARRN